MTWLTLIAGVISAIVAALNYLQQKQAIDTATAGAVAAHLQGALDEIGRAQKARDAVRSAPPGQLRDPDTNSRD